MWAMHFLFAYVCLYAFMCMHHTSTVCMPFLQDGQFDKFCASRRVLTQTDMLQQQMSELFRQRQREKSSSAVGKLEFCFTWKPLIIYISILHASESDCICFYSTVTVAYTFHTLTHTYCLCCFTLCVPFCSFSLLIFVLSWPCAVGKTLKSKKLTLF